MSFTDDYLALRKKRKKNEQETPDVKKPLYVNKTAPLYRGANPVVTMSNKKQEDDYAPVGNTKNEVNQSPYMQTVDFSLKEKELETLSSLYNKASELSNKITQIDNRPKYAAMAQDDAHWNKEKEKLQSELDAILQGYGSVGKLQTLVHTKKQELNLGKLDQKITEMASVMNEKDFRNFAKDNKTVDDDLYAFINNRDNAQAAKFEVAPYYNNAQPMTSTGYGAMASAPVKTEGNAEVGLGEYTNKGYHLLTEEEKSIFNYHWAKNGKKKAMEWLDSLQVVLNDRMATAKAENMEGDIAKQLLFGVNAGLDQFSSGLTGAGNAVTGDDEVMIPSVTQMTSAKVREGMGGVGKFAYDLTTTTANMLPSILASTAANFIVPGSGAVVGTLTMGTSAGGNAYQEMINNGYDANQARTYGVLVGGSEAILQKALGGITKLSGGGGGVFQNLVGKALPQLENGLARFAVKFGSNMLDEGLEEGIQEVLDPIFQRMVGNPDADVDWGEVAYAALLGTLSGGVMESTSVPGAVKAYKNGIDPVTGLTANEKKVVDKVYEDRVAEAEKDGKLSQKDKDEIFDKVVEEMDRGYISTDTIEEVLGGDTYKSYKDTVDNEDALAEQQKTLTDEYNALNKKVWRDMTGEEMDRREELKAQLADLDTQIKSTQESSQRNQLKSQLGLEVSKLVKSDRLSESYNERARRGQVYEADLTQYDAKQRETIQKAIDSGILNNTNRTHEFVDIIAKISADKGVPFDFVNNAKLKETGFAVDGKTVNGYYSNGTIGVNIDSPKAWQSTVGHEITHVLEGTDMYNTLQETLFEYAKTKGEYDTRLKDLTELYKNIKDADVKAELTSDLVGDYLFTDKDFINNLSTKHRNIFEKVYDEIKYLYKVATAGSKEARELEKVKKAFEDAYRADSNASGDTKLSISDSEGKQLTKEQQDYFKDSKVRDENGNLKVMYHGSPESFTVFDRKKAKASGYYGKGFYFTDSDSHAKQYGNTYDVYLNITNPLQDGTNDITKEQLRKFVEAIAENEDYGIDNYGYGATVDSVTDNVYGKSDFAMLMDINASCVGNMVEAIELFNEVNDTDYNGIIASTETVAFYPNQIKSVDNKTPTSDPDIRFSLSGESDQKTDIYSRVFDLQSEVGRLNRAIEDFERSDAFKEGNDIIAEAMRSNDVALGMERYVQWRKSSGYEALVGSRDALRVELENLYKERDNLIASEGDEAEKKAIAKSGLSEPDYFRKQAVKEFGYTPYFYDAGYITPNGKMLNFSGEKGKHFGSRGQDHRGIGIIYENTQGSDAMVRFMNDGNIRIMGETPGLDIASPVEPTNEQYATIRKFARESAGGEYFAVDFSDEKGRVIGHYEYEGRINADRVVNDIKYFFQNGKVRESSGLSNFLSLSNNGEQTKYGNFSTPANELRLEQEIAPVAETDDSAERLASLTDADVPPEADTYYGEEDDVPVAPRDPFEDRDFKEVGKRNVNAYMYDNPEVKPFFQMQAKAMLGDLQNSVKGERWYNDDVYYESGGEYGWSGTERQTTDDIAYLLDMGYTYAQIEYGLKAIIEDNGAENIAIAKRIEFALNDRLSKGYTDINGMEIPANEDYLNLLAQKQTAEAVEWQIVPHTDADAPAEDIAPVKEQPASESKVAKVKVNEEVKTKKTFGEKVRDALDSTKKTVNTAVSTFGDKGWVFENLSKKTKNRELEAKYNFLHYSESRAQEYIKDNLMPIVERVKQTGKTEDVFNYVYHLHNIDRMSLETDENRIKRESLRENFKGLTDKQIENIAMEWIKKDTPRGVKKRIQLAREYIDANKGKNKPVFGDSVTADVSREAVKKYEAENPEFKELESAIVEYNRQLRKMLVDGNVISQETADVWEKMYPHYVPIRRTGKDGLGVTVPLDTNKTGVNAPIKRATGGDSDIEDLFETMVMRTEQTFKAIAKNSFGVELMHTLDSSVAKEKTTLDSILDSFDSHEDLLQEGKKGQSPTFTVFEDGKRVTFEITQDMYNALKPTSENLAKTYKIPNAISNIHRGLLTDKNPVFLATNVIKDAQDVMINSQHAGKTYMNFPTAIRELASKGQWFKEYMANGGEQNTYFDSDSKTFKGEDKGVKKWLNGISEANNFIERIPRLAEYIASRKAGRSIEVSMLDAARVTTNFAAGADMTKFLNRNGFTFLNASVQGAMQQVRNVREANTNGLKGWAMLAGKVAGVGLAHTILNHLLWDDDEEYEELSDYVKQNYYIVAKTDDGKFIRIPKGRTMAVIQEAFTQMENLVTGDDEADLGNFAELVIANLAPNNPLDNNILAPVIQAATNTTWYGEDLVPTRLQDVPDAEQYDEGTDAFSKWLGEKTDFSPYKINYLLNQYSGGIGDVFLPMMTPEAESGDDSFLGNIVAPWKDKFSTDSVMKNQNVSDFYDKVDELKVNANSSKATDEDVLMSKYMSAVNSQLSELYQQKREIQNNIIPEGAEYDHLRELYDGKTIPDDVKYAEVHAIQEQINALARNGLNTYSDVSIEGVYATVGDVQFRWHEPGEDSEAEAGWKKLTDDQIEKQDEVTKGLGISPSEYWSDKGEYDFAYEYPDKYDFLKDNGVTYDDYKNGSEEFKEAWTWASKNPEKFTLSKAVASDVVTYRKYTSDLYDIKADKDENGKSISGSRKEKVIDYINNMDADYGEKIILFKSEYEADDTYNYEIIDYLNSREDISYEEMATILKELGFKVSSDGTITWD